MGGSPGVCRVSAHGTSPSEKGCAPQSGKWDEPHGEPICTIALPGLSTIFTLIIRAGRLDSSFPSLAILSSFRPVPASLHGPWGRPPNTVVILESVQYHYTGLISLMSKRLRRFAVKSVQYRYTLQFYANSSDIFKIRTYLPCSHGIATRG